MTSKADVRECNKCKRWIRRDESYLIRDSGLEFEMCDICGRRLQQKLLQVRKEVIEQFFQEGRAFDILKL